MKDKLDKWFFSKSKAQNSKSKMIVRRKLKERLSLAAYLIVTALVMIGMSAAIVFALGKFLQWIGIFN